MNNRPGERIAGVVGWPLDHSLSPRLHRYWLSVNKIEGSYIPLPAEPQKFALLVPMLVRTGFRGVNVTAPHKEAAFAIANWLDDAALITRSVNLLIFRDDRSLEGRNTDAFGLAANLRSGLEENELLEKTAVILGAGGAARGAALALNDLGIRNIRILARRKPAAEAMAGDLSESLSSRFQTFDWDQWNIAAEGADIVVNATGAGTLQSSSLDLPLDALPKSAVVCDLVYNPLETELLKAARLSGRRTVDGLGMLIYQAVPAFEAFYGQTPKASLAVRQHLIAGIANG